MAISVGERPEGSSGLTPPEAGAGRAPRERFWNLPNTITVLRTGAVPVLLLLPLVGHSWLASHVVAWCFIVAAVTDILDGWLARRGQLVTRIGKLLDPLADKLLVSTALIVLLVSPYPDAANVDPLRLQGRIPDWGAVMVVVIVGRELAVTGLRGIASAGGQVMGANWMGKAKALSQNIAIGALLFPRDTLGIAHQLGMTLLLVATALTLWSGYRYFAQYFGERGADAEGSG